VTDLCVVLEETKNVPVAMIVLDKADLFIGLTWHVRILYKLALLDRFKLRNGINSSLGLLIGRNLVLAWPDDTS